MRRACGFAALLLVSNLASAQERERAEARLAYTVQEELECPEQSAFRDAVAARLGYDPFREQAPRLIEAKITRAGRRLQGRVRVLDDKNAVVGSRRLEAAEGECAELVSSLAIAVSILLDPFSAVGPAPAEQGPPEAPPAPPPQPPPRAPPPPPPPECPKPVPPEDPARIFVAGDVGASFALTPGLALGPSVSLGVTWSRLLIAAQGRADFTPVSVETDAGDRVVAAVFSAGPRGCLRAGLGIGCASVQAGIFQGRGVDLIDARTQTAAFASVDVAGGVSIGLGESSSLLVLGEVRAPLARTGLNIEGETVWTAPPLAFGLRIGIAADFSLSDDGKRPAQTSP